MGDIDPNGKRLSRNELSDRVVEVFDRGLGVVERSPLKLDLLDIRRREGFAALGEMVEEDSERATQREQRWNQQRERSGHGPEPLKESLGKCVKHGAQFGF